MSQNSFDAQATLSVGDRSYVVGTQDLRSSYKLGVGDMTLDLRGVRFTRAETHVKARRACGLRLTKNSPLK